ncbi:hypothetical protein LCGC14_1985560 [marine sediment metagenome]|uniref:Uncharacterized protein n=1 Tax=marine sediment metagenome TaxID=412755 RepID=A0A0F9I4Q2_9ZZZZ
MAKTTLDKLKSEALSQQVSEVKEERLVKIDNKAIEVVSQFKSFKWDDVPPQAMAVLLTKIPRKGRKNEPDWYMTIEQGLIHALRCKKWDIDPTDTHLTWFNRETWESNLMAEGNEEVARNKGINLGPPSFETLSRNHKGKDEIGVRCTRIVNGDRENPVSYTAWLSEWKMNTGQWATREEWMLHVRSEDKLTQLCMGVGISSSTPEGSDLAPPDPVPQIDTTTGEITHPQLTSQVEDNDGTKAEHYKLK